jgi:anti-sigma factor RsiW
MNEYCSNLDNYLLDDLSQADAAAFAAHLESCDECREAVDEQQWIDNLLQASSRLETQVPPPHIANELQVFVSRHESYRRRAVTIALAVAAAILIAATWLFNHSNSNSPEQVATTNEEPVPTAQPRATFAAAGNVIAVPVKSSHPDVTIVRVYSTLQPTNNLKMAAFEPEATSLNNSPDFSNGG